MESHYNIDDIKAQINEMYSTLDEVHLIEPLINKIVNEEIIIIKTDPDDSSKTIHLSKE
jgi:hypothetical protein